MQDLDSKYLPFFPTAVDQQNVVKVLLRAIKNQTLTHRSFIMAYLRRKIFHLARTYILIEASIYRSRNPTRVSHCQSLLTFQAPIFHPWVPPGPQSPRRRTCQ